MPIRWSAVKVSQAMDGVEGQVNLADAFLVEAREKARNARNIENLPGYMTDRLIRLITELERIDKVRECIEAVRKAIPSEAIELEQQKTRHGSQQSLI